jgi:hypothetical protein
LLKNNPLLPKKHKQMDALPQIALPQRSLMNLVHAAYKDVDPVTYISHLLEPYYITAEQVEALAANFYWPGRPHPSHPLYGLVKDLLKSTNPEQRKCLDHVNKERFIAMATSISHVWVCPLATKLGGGLRRICTYQGASAPIPHAWLHADRQGMMTLCAASAQMPALAIVVHRTCVVGRMLPLELDLNVDQGSPFGCSYLHVYLDMERAQGAIEVELWAADKAGAEQLPNYALLFTRSADVCQLAQRGAYLLSPSLGRVWGLPLMLHTIEESDL